MKIILCDDERQIHEDIRAHAAQYTQKKSVVIQLEDCYSAEELIELGEHGDAVLLDIDMPGMDGIEAARILRKENRKLTIVMLTGKRERFKEAFMIGAVRFVTKPVEEDELFEALDYVTLSSVGQELLKVRYNGSECEIMQRDICVIEAKSDYLAIYTKYRRYESRERLGNILGELDEKLFIEIHKSYIINMQHVKGIAKYRIVMDDDTKLPIARRRYNDVLQKMVDFDRMMG